MADRTDMFYGAYEFNPVPLFSWSTDLVRDVKGDQLFARNTLNFDGVLLETTGESGNFPTLMTKREQLKDALASGNQEWRLTYDGATIISGVYPRTNGPTFEAGIWFDQINYTFDFEFDEPFGSGANIQSFSENWNFEENEDRRTVTVNHTINAVGIDTSNGGANNSFSNAKDFVLSKTGFSNAPIGSPFFAQVSGVANPFEELRSEAIDIQAGSYTVNESFILSSGNFIHTRTVQFAQDEEGIVTVTIDGNVQGLGRGDSAFTNALNAYNNEIRPEFASVASGAYGEFNGAGTIFTSNERSLSVTKNEFAGTIGYGVSYTDSLSDNLPSGIQEFSLSVVDNKPTRVFAVFPVIEDPNGPLVQDIQTTKEGTYTVNGNAKAKVGLTFEDLLAFVEGEINDNAPSFSAQNIFLDQLNINENRNDKSVTFNVVWRYTVSLTNAAEGTVVNIV